MTAVKQLGEAAVVVGTDTFIVRVGIRELAALETEFKVDGLNAVWKEVRRSETAWLRFARIALSRRHPDLPEDKLADIVDWCNFDKVDPETRTPLKSFTEAVTEAMTWAMPVSDPNEKPATEIRVLETSA